MVQLVLDGLRGGLEHPGAEAPADAALEVFHVDARLSDSIGDIGHAGWRKVWRLLGYCGQAVWARLRHGVKCFYYIPAPGLRAAVYRDWIVMALCRPFFPVVVYHWQAMGLGDWIESTARPWERWISRRLLARPELSIVLGEINRRDAQQLESKQVAVIANAIADPCPRFESEMLATRIERAQARASARGEGDAEQEFRVMYIGLCHREKGLFDAVEAIALANRQLGDAPLRITLSVAGGFWQESDRVEFDRRIGQPDLLRRGVPLVTYLGFVSGPEKRQLFARSDCLCFPTYYSAESFGLVVLEAMAWGLHLVTTRWRTVPELLPPEYPGVVEIKAPQEIAAKLVESARRPYEPGLRARFLERYTADQFARSLRKVLEELTGNR